MSMLMMKAPQRTKTSLASVTDQTKPASAAMKMNAVPQKTMNQRTAKCKQIVDGVYSAVGSAE